MDWISQCSHPIPRLQCIAAIGRSTLASQRHDDSDLTADSAWMINESNPKIYDHLRSMIILYLLNEIKVYILIIL